MPAAAKGFVDADEVLGDQAVAVGNGLAKGKKRALGVEDVVKINEAVEELVLGQTVGFARGGFGGEQGFATGVLARVRGKAGTEFGDGFKHGLLVK